MGSMNKVFLIGNLTRDPELRYTPSRTVVSDLGLAISENYKNKEGEQVESTCFVDIVLWRRQAEVCQKYLSKGLPVMIEGRLQLDRWETDQGEKHSRLRVRANRVQFLGQPRNLGIDSDRDKQYTEPVPAGVSVEIDDKKVLF
ncbi:MAG: single-stranded DNA-binding protein [Kiritimatiellae bacterium]|nr:single-stranded DNA-binding protein [Kiritimatiellia bacterium]